MTETKCESTIVFNSHVYICQLEPGHFDDQIHEDGVTWEVISDDRTPAASKDKT